MHPYAHGDHNICAFARAASPHTATAGWMSVFASQLSSCDLMGSAIRDQDREN